MTSSPDRELATALRKRRFAIAEVFANAMAATPRWRPIVESKRDDWRSFVELEFGAFADYLASYYESGDETFRSMLIGEKIKAFYDPNLDDDARRGQSLEVSRLEADRFGALLGSSTTPQGLARLQSDVRDIGALLAAKRAKQQRLLLVGDCLFLDIVPFMLGALLEHGISIVTQYATSKSPLALRDELRVLAPSPFDLVFYSPFTYEFSPRYTALLDWRRSAASASAIEHEVDEIWRVEVEPVLRQLADAFDCPVYVHNSSAVLREESPLRRAAKQRATRRTRGVAAARANRLLGDWVRSENERTFPHVFVLDEAGVASAVGEFRAGAYLYRSELQHPAVLGRELARSYVDIVFVNAFLAGKKVVVSDLDNTLWSGVIGEGAVVHLHERQAMLKELKKKGVVLAVNSKNDPANVQWRGGTLQDDDFVFQAVSWEPKSRGMTRIQEALNLKTKDFVFVDDREDELALMKAAHPQVLCLNAEDPGTWDRLRLWHARLEDELEMDRTLMYRQRDKREAFVAGEAVDDAERLSLYAALELALDVEPARQGDLKRVSELINRTSQFNVEGSRVTYKEVCAWHASRSHLILLGKTRDRFGPMGTTCVAVARVDGEQMVLLPFVLSCRVFGYGIERAVMNELKRIAKQRGARELVGRYVATPQNAPCKDFLAAEGFRSVGGRWLFEVESGPSADPAWLRVARK